MSQPTVTGQLDVAKMSADKLSIRRAMLSMYQDGVSPAEVCRKLRGIFGKDSFGRSTVHKWFRRFRAGDFKLADDYRSGRPRQVSDADIKALLELEPTLSAREIAAVLNVSKTCVHERLVSLRCASVTQSSMETLTTEGSNSNEALKDFSRSKLKLNGDMNGSVAMEVDADSHDSDYKKDRKDSLSGDVSNDGSSKMNNGGEHSTDTEGDQSGGEDSQDVVSSNSKLQHSENSNSQQGYHEPMEVDGDSVNSQEGNLANSDAEKSKKDSEIETEEDEEEEEESDVNKGGDELSIKSKDLVGTDSEQPISGRGGENSERSEDIKRDNAKTNEESVSSGNDSEKVPKKIKDPQVTITPRRSSRTVQKPVRFGQEEANSSDEDAGNESDGIEEITPQDPLADAITDIRKIPRKIGNTTIVVKDTKRLADIAARNTNTNKKEPTLVIIDTNSILSGRGPVPVAQSTPSQIQLPSVTVTPQPSHIPPAAIHPSSVPQQQTHHVKSHPNLPAALPAQGLYPPKPVQRPPPILPMLTDDMYVVEAPSFIVPYVYEKPPVKKFKKYVRKFLKQIKIQEEEAIKREAERVVETKEETDVEKADGEKAKSESSEGVSEQKGDGEVKSEETPCEEKKDEEKEKDEEGKKKDGEKKSAVCESIEDSIKASEIKKKENGAVTVKEVSIIKKSSGKENKKDGVSSTDEEDTDEEEEKKKPAIGGSYFDNPLGKFFMEIGMNLVQQFVQTDLLKQHKKKQKLGKGNDDTQAAINSLKKNLQMSKENNEPYTMEQNKCDYCSFKTESKLIMAHHLETPHMRNYVYRCNFCPLEVRGPHDILFHMEAEHNIRGRLERAPAFHQCPQCPFEDNQKGKLTRHLLTCQKKFRPEKNLEPPMDWEPPAKIPRMTRKPPMPMNVNNSIYQQALASKNLPQALIPKMVSPLNNQQNAMLRARGRPNFPAIPPNPKLMLDKRPIPNIPPRANMVYRPGANTGSQQVLVPTSYQLTGNQIFQKNPAAVKLLNQPSISITPLPRQPTNSQPSTSAGAAAPRQQPGAAGGSNTTFVICEICDGYVKHLEQLRNHMQWIHKVKIHPKMICNRPPLNCQKCQFRFFTDQGLERHLLGSHGLVTSSMQESANEGKDGGRCPVCGRAYQWKLLNHVARDHNMTLKPAHLSYKCTVCTATFGMYKQFENHVYSAHSVVAKRVMDRRNGQSSSNSPSTSSGNRTETPSQVKPFKISDEITIIPQRANKPQTSSSNRPVPGTSRVSIQPRNPQQSKPQTDSVQVIDLEDSPLKGSGSGENGGVESLSAVKERLRRRKSLEIRQVESEPDHSEGESEEFERESTSRSKANSANEEEDEEMPQEEEEDEGKGHDEEDEEEEEREKGMEHEGEEEEG